MPYLGSGLAKFVLTLWMYCPTVLRDCSQEGKWVIPLGWVTLFFPDQFHNKKQRNFKSIFCSCSPLVLVEFVTMWCGSFLIHTGRIRDLLMFRGWLWTVQPPEILLSMLLVNGRAGVTPSASLCIVSPSSCSSHPLYLAGLLTSMRFLTLFSVAVLF